MLTIEPTNRDVINPDQRKRYSAPLRLWHWINLIVISGSLLTVLINSTINKRRNTVPLIQDQLKQKGITITQDQANAVGHALSDKVWDIHVYFGYALTALLVCRLVLEFFQFADQKLTRKIKSAYLQFQTIKKQREVARHELTVKLIYALFYMLLIIMVVTGLALAFDDDLPFMKSIGHQVKNVHGFCMYLILAFIVVHLVGVFLAERDQGKGIVSDMINGGNENNS